MKRYEVWLYCEPGLADVMTCKTAKQMRTLAARYAKEGSFEGRKLLASHAQTVEIFAIEADQATEESRDSQQ